MTVEQTGTLTDLTGGMPATDPSLSLAALEPFARRTLTAVAERLIPAAHGMPSAADVVTDQQLAFVLGARPDLADPLRAALRPELGEDVGARLDRLAADEPTNLSTLQLVIVAGYYTDPGVRQLIGYAGQQAIPLESWPGTLTADSDEIASVVARGPVWRDPATGKRAVPEEGAT